MFFPDKVLDKKKKNYEWVILRMTYAYIARRNLFLRKWAFFNGSMGRGVL